MPRRSDRRLYGWEWDVWVAREELVTCITAVERSPHAGIGNGLFSGKTGKVLAGSKWQNIVLCPEKRYKI